MTNDLGEKPLFDELAEWRQRGAALRSKLVEEKRELVRRLSEIDQALSELPSNETAPGESTGPTGQPLSPMLTTPELVWAIVVRQADGISASEIVRQAVSVKPKLDPSLIHATIFRLTKSGRFEATGRRGARIYRVAHHENLHISDHFQSHDRYPQPRNPRAGYIHPESQIGRSVAILREAGKPLHAREIAHRIRGQTGKPVNLHSLVGALARSAKTKAGGVCRSSEPNVFGLLEWAQRPAIDPEKLPATHWVNQAARVRDGLAAERK
jgi:hypothetical protein